MSTLQITYAGYKFHETGVTQYGHGMQPAGPGGVPRKFIETFRLKHRFFETSFADNEARWNALKTVIRANPRGRLIITDERGQTVESRMVKCAGAEGGEEWGQYRREIELSFEAVGGVLTVSEQTAGFTPTGRTQITLPNVESMSGGIKTERPTTHSAIRREQIETVAMSGKWTANPEDTIAAKRDALLAKKAEIESIADAPDGVLVYGSFSKTMQIEAVSADIGDGTDELTWTLSAFRRNFPDGVFAESEYEVDFSDDREDGTRTVTVAGRVVADTKANAEAAALAIKNQFTAGRQFLNQQLRRRVISGTDGTDDCTELSFSYRFRETFGAVVSYKLTITHGYDAKAGDETTTYAGNVYADSTATALAKARELGFGKEDGRLYLMSSNEQMAAASVEDVVTANSVDFTYVYLGKSAIAFAEVSYDTSTEFFGANSFTISGSCTATSQAAALTFARTFKVTGLLERSVKETPIEAVKQSAAYTLLTRLDFAYAYAKAATRSTVSYAKESAHDFDARETSITVSGTAYGASEAACGAAIDAISNPGVSGARKTRSSRTPNFDKDHSNSVTLLASVNFTESWKAPLQVADGALILEAQYSVAKSFGLWVAQIDEIPGAAPYVQENVKRTCGQITVSGSITVVASGEATARSWARGKRAYATGHLDQYEETPDYNYLSRSGTDVKAIRFGFTYASRDPNLYTGG
jgi:hypothetical protein